MKRLRVLAKHIWVNALFATGILWLAKQRLRLAGNVVVLTFHRVLDDDEYDQSRSLRGIRVRANTFERFIEWASRNFETVKHDAVTLEKATRRMQMVVTLDDGWIDTYTRAHPIAEKYGVPLTVFVCSGLAGRTNPFWPERVCSLMRTNALRRAPYSYEAEERIVAKLKHLTAKERELEIRALASTLSAAREAFSDDPLDLLMTWEQVRTLHNAGVTIGSHTVSHPLLTTITSEEAERELAESRLNIEQALGAPCSALAYPNGSLTVKIRQMAAEAGYQVAFTTEAGYWDPDADLLKIPRLNIWEQSLTNYNGRFSRAMAEYSIFWRRPA